MSKLFGVNRREFLVAAAIPLYAAGPLQTFSGDEARLVEALCDQVIPADDLGRAMVDVAVRGTAEREAQIFENRDIRAMVKS